MWRKVAQITTNYEADLLENGRKLGIASWWNGRHKGLKRRLILPTLPLLHFKYISNTNIKQFILCSTIVGSYE
jgi:hypothetical protein